MKDQLQTFLRHVLTWFAGLGAFLFAHGLIGEGDVQAVNSDGATLGSSLVAILTVIIMRFLMTTVAAKFPALSKLLGTSGSGGSVKSLVILVCTAAVFMTALSSCSSFSKIPITGSVTWRDPNSGAKAALTVGNKASRYAAPKVRAEK